MTRLDSFKKGITYQQITSEGKRHTDIHGKEAFDLNFQVLYTYKGLPAWLDLPSQSFMLFDKMVNRGEKHIVLTGVWSRAPYYSSNKDEIIVYLSDLVYRERYNHDGRDQREFAIRIVHKSAGSDVEVYPRTYGELLRVLLDNFERG